MEKTEIKTKKLIDSLKNGTEIKGVKDGERLLLKIEDIYLPEDIFGLYFIENAIKKDGDVFKLDKKTKLAVINAMIIYKVETSRQNDVDNYHLDALYRDISSNK